MNTTNIIIIILLSIVIISIIFIVIYLVYKANKKNDYQNGDLSNPNNLSLLHLNITKDFKNILEEKLNKETSNIRDIKDNFFKDIKNDIDSINLKIQNEFSKNNQYTNDNLKDLSTKLALLDKSYEIVSESQKEILKLQDIFKDKKARGNLGEFILENIIKSIFGENDRYYKFQYKLKNNTIADLVIFSDDPLKLFCIDSKFPLTNYQKITDDNLTNTQVQDAVKEFKKDVKKHIDDIKNKYIIKNETADFAIMCIPSEAIFSYIVSNLYDMVCYAQEHKIIIASPTTLPVMISNVYMAIKNIEHSKFANEIAKKLSNLKDEFERFSKRFQDLENNFKNTSESFDEINITSKKLVKQFLDVENIKEIK